MWTPRAFLIGLAALLICGCGGSARQTLPKDGRVTVTLDEFSLSPAELESEDGRVRATVFNNGRIAHTWRVLSKDGRVTYGGTSALTSGRTERVDLRLRKGTYLLACAIGDHKLLGMRGELIVRRSAPGASARGKPTGSKEDEEQGAPARRKNEGKKAKREKELQP